VRIAPSPVVLVSALIGSGLLVAAAETACSSKPTTVAAWKSVCELPRKRDLSAGSGSARVAAGLAAAREATGDSEVRAVIDQAAAGDPDAAGATLRSQAAAASVASCPLADLLERTTLADRCRHGAGDACLAGARLYASTSIYPDEERTERPHLLELACLHGVAAGCAERAGLGDADRWKAAACRRGDQASCPPRPAKGAATPAPLRARLADLPAGAEPVIDRVRTVYAASLEECAEASRPAGGGSPAAAIAVDFTIADGLAGKPAVKAGGVAAVETCMRERVAGWAFPGAAAGKAYRLRFDLAEATPGSDMVYLVESVKRRAAAMDLGTPRPPRGPRVILLDMAAEHDGPVQTGELEHRFLISLHSGFEACYRDALRRDKGAGGVAVIGARVEAGGRFGDVRVEDAFDDELGSCLARKVDTWRVPVLNTDRGARLHIKTWFEVVE